MVWEWEPTVPAPPGRKPRMYFPTDTVEEAAVRANVMIEVLKIAIRRR